MTEGEEGGEAGQGGEARALSCTLIRDHVAGTCFRPRAPHRRRMTTGDAMTYL
jgi:hypothetical protein